MDITQDYMPTINQLIHLTPLSPARFLTIAVVTTGVVLLLELKELPLFNQNRRQEHTLTLSWQ